MAPTDGNPGPPKSKNHPDESQRAARSDPPPQGQPSQWSAPRLDPQLLSLLQEPVPSNDNFVIATRCSTLDGSGLLFHGDGVNMLVPFTMLDEQNQLRFGHTDKFESLDWLAVANIQKPKANFNRPTVTTRSSRKPQPQPQPPARPNPSRPQPVTPQVPPRGRRSGRDATRGNTTDNGEGPSEDKRVGRSRGPR
ncbi:hypothetical protein CDV31_000986 [Fusarium ambrosium]|uniref:Uncharacterized protein n=1 Tax=Fusarium ambrosium TaxID=131363 RepID=A0A428V0Y6_9HYPO|nr:hypothetical protein CDV31_000986 [Fusarium ambrosium]